MYGYAYAVNDLVERRKLMMQETGEHSLKLKLKQGILAVIPLE